MKTLISSFLFRLSIYALYRILSPTIWTNVKVDTQFYEYEGKKSSGCDYGGIVFLDKDTLIASQARFTESLKLCDQTSRRQHHPTQAFYSRKSSFLLVLYQYKWYSSVKLKASACATICQAVQVNICVLNFLKKMFFQSLFRGHWSHKLSLLHASFEHFLLVLKHSPCVVLQLTTDKYWKKDHRKEFVTFQSLPGPFQRLLVSF